MSLPQWMEDAQDRWYYGGNWVDESTCTCEECTSRRLYWHIEPEATDYIPEPIGADEMGVAWAWSSEEAHDIKQALYDEALALVVGEDWAGFQGSVRIGKGPDLVVKTHPGSYGEPWELYAIRCK